MDELLLGHLHVNIWLVVITDTSQVSPEALEQRGFCFGAALNFGEKKAKMPLKLCGS